MNELAGRVIQFQRDVFPHRSDLYERLAIHGQRPKALMISCADSRVVPEEIMHADPGDLFVCRNAGNIVPPYAQANGGVTSTVEYAVEGLGVNDIIVCGHSDCGAMKALLDPQSLSAMPNVAAWLKHSHAVGCIVESSYAHLDPAGRLRAAILENVVAQLAHLRTHPSVAAAIARGTVSLHGWFFDIHAGEVLALDGQTNRFAPIREDRPMPIALEARPRQAADLSLIAEAAE
jgi:carbonic anhydrase